MGKRKKRWSAFTEWEERFRPSDGGYSSFMKNGRWMLKRKETFQNKSNTRCVNDPAVRHVRNISFVKSGLIHHEVQMWDKRRNMKNVLTIKRNRNRKDTNEESFPLWFSGRTRRNLPSKPKGGFTVSETIIGQKKNTNVSVLKTRRRKDQTDGEKRQTGCLWERERHSNRMAERERERGTNTRVELGGFKPAGVLGRCVSLDQHHL